MRGISSTPWVVASRSNLSRTHDDAVTYSRHGPRIGVLERGHDGDACRTHRNLRTSTLRFHRYPHCVLLGHSQDGCRVADTDFCRHESIEVVRRVTGGGAVFMSPRMFAWDVVVDRRFWGGGLADVSRGICGGIVRGLSHLGVIGLFRPPNAIVIGERKVSGSSGYVEGRSVVLQGTLLISDEVPTMAKALRIPEMVLRAQTPVCLPILSRWMRSRRLCPKA